MKKSTVHFSRKTWFILIIFILFPFLTAQSQSDGFLFEDMDLDIEDEPENSLYDSSASADDFTYPEDTTIMEFGYDLEQGVLIPPVSDNSETDSAIVDSTEISAINNKEVPTVKKSGEKIHFYQKWWFTLLILLPIGYFVFVYYRKKESEWNSRLNQEKSSATKINSLLKEKEEYYLQKENEYKAKLSEEEELKFHAIGLNKFSEIISKNKENLSKLGQQIIYELVEYVGANAGAIYLVNSDSDELHLDLLSAYAPDKKQLKSRFSPGEGYIGTCFEEGNMLEITNVPDSYAKIASGLGKAQPRYLAFFPVIQDEQKLGVIEIAAFKKLDQHKLEFIQKLSQNVASSIAIQQATDKMQAMLEQSKVQAEELRAQEEELRQNLEEMKATQEELNRQAEQNKKMQQELLKENAFMEALMNNLPDYIYFKDRDSKFIKNSLSHAKIFGLKDPKELIGKSDFDFFSDEHAKPAFDAEQDIIKTGKPIIDLVEKEIKKDGSVSWVSTTKLPLKDAEGNTIGTFGISRDISKAMNLEMETREKNEELLAQEEELRQNLEEMQSVQEELQRQKDELDKEQALMNALLENANETIYFKDRESKFIKASHSMAKHFKLKRVEELYGKSDFDFFTEEHARPAYEDEMNIIKTGDPIINKVEKETHADGRISWVSTNKMPLYDNKKNIIGTFGISKDITNIKEMEIEIKQRNEELQAQEEELRQNLEEMQTTQEELTRQVDENNRIQEELLKENAFMEALMNNLPDYIYFKDRDSKFIKNSLSHAKIFGLKDPKELVGKSDFDFFSDEHAKPAFDAEQKIIKTGKPIIDLIEKEVKKDGSVSWVSTTKLPLKDANGKTIGTFGISRDITNLKQLEDKLKQIKKK